MVLTIVSITVMYLCVVVACGQVHNVRDLIKPDRPLVIAHRGSSGQLPGHTLAAYELAIQQGADYIECDVCMSKDRQLICLHEPALSVSTDVASRPQFSQRRRNLTFWGVEQHDWFSSDFTLAELKTLRIAQQFSFRDQSYNGKYPIPTFEEFIQVVKNATCTVGIYPEAKHPDFYNRLDSMKGERMENMMVDILNKYGYTNSNDDCFIQSFDEESIQHFSTITKLPLIQLIWTEQSDKALQKFARYCYGIGPDKSMILPPVKYGGKFKLGAATDLIERAHKVGLKVHPWTFRNEDRYLAWDYGQDMYKEYETFVKLGVDGLFTDFPATLHSFLIHQCN